MVGKDLCTNSTHNTYTGRAEDSPGVVMVVVVEEAGGAVETERGGWEVGGTAEDEDEEGVGVADSVAARWREKGRKNVCSNRCKQFEIILQR